MSRRIVVVGASGTIGRPLCAELIRSGHSLVVFSRDPVTARQAVPDADRYVAWQPEELSDECRAQLRSANCVVYLAGGALFDGRRHHRADIEADSRVRINGLETLVNALPDTSVSSFISASSVGYYGYAGRRDEVVDETAPQGPDWWGKDCAALEAAALAATGRGIRTVVVRTGYVLTRASLRLQVAQFDRHAGGWIGLGRGWTPWIHIVDEVGIIVAALDQPAYEGPVNATAPEPVRARTFARTMGQTLGRRAWLPAPTPFVRTGLGAVTDIIVKGKRVIPAQALANNYQFQFDNLQDALADLLSST